MNCCSYLFAKFRFQDLRSAEPPSQKGVYVIRVKERGKNPKQIIAQVKLFLEKLNWEMVGDFVTNRMSRLDRIVDCPVIYIGANQKRGKNTLKDRYTELANRHTIMYPLWVLIYYGWDFEFGWRVAENPESLEKQLKQQYQGLHGGNLPSLVKR